MRSRSRSRHSLGPAGPAPRHTTSGGVLCKIRTSVAQSCPQPMDCSTPASLSITSSRSLFRLVSTESVMPSNHLILCRPLLLPPQSFLASGSFQESAVSIRWPKYLSLSFSISPSIDYSGLISLRMDWLDLLAVLQMGFPDGSVDKESTCNTGDIGNGNPLQYSCLGNPMNRGAWWTPVHGVTRVRHNFVTKPPVLQTSFSPRIFPCHYVCTDLRLILESVMPSVVSCLDERLVTMYAAVDITVHISCTCAFSCGGVLSWTV